MSFVIFNYITYAHTYIYKEENKFVNIKKKDIFLIKLIFFLKYIYNIKSRYITIANRII